MELAGCDELTLGGIPELIVSASPFPLFSGIQVVAKVIAVIIQGLLCPGGIAIE